MALQKWVEGAGKIAAATVLPDFKAWRDISEGRGSTGDYASAGLDVVSLIPGGSLVKGAGKLTKVGLKHVDELGALKKWNSNAADQLWHGPEKAIGRGENIVPRAPRSPAAISQESRMYYKDPLIPGSAFPEGFGAPGAGQKAARLAKTAPRRGMDHATYAFATPHEAEALKFGSGRAVGVLPLSPRKDLRVLSPYEDAMEVADPRGFRPVLKKHHGKTTYAADDSRAALQASLKKGRLMLRTRGSALAGLGALQVAVNDE